MKVQELNELWQSELPAAVVRANHNKALSDATLGLKKSSKPKSETHRQNISATLKASTRNKGLQSSIDSGLAMTSKIVICPHCSKVGKQLIMRRWHFDNCRMAVTGFTPGVN